MLRIALILAVALPVAAAPPTGPAPRVSGVSNPPPPAWVAASSGSRWLAYSSFCWTTSCVDFIPPAQRADLPRVRVRLGETITFHVRFAPKSVTVTMLPGGKPQTLAAARSARWRVRSVGTLVLAAKGPQGSASYVAKLVAPRTGY